MSGAEVRIGLEMHVQITSLKTKLFCNCSADYRGKPPNTLVCPVCLGLPGALPLVNEKALEKALMAALALNMEVAPAVYWTRKHYFYPDLPKNYQISQFEGRGAVSIAKNGYVDLQLPDGRAKRIRVRRLSIEEDPGRIVYPRGSMLTSPYVLVDYNRSGVALLEVVTEPDFSDEVEVSAFLYKVRSLLEHLDVTDFSLEGAIRVDVNISVGGGERVEIKNLGSISDVVQAIRYERERQRDLLRKGERVKRETRHWDPVRKVTVAVRAKEREEDYRYMPDPNLPPVPITQELVEKVKASMPELPEAKLERLVAEHGVSRYAASVLVSRRALYEYYLKVSELSGLRGDRVANYIINDVLGWVPEGDPALLWKVFPPEVVAKVLAMLERGEITIKMAKEMLPELAKGRSPEEVLEEMGWSVLRNEESLRRVVSEVFAKYEKAVEDALKSERAVQFLVGKALEATGKRADPRLLYKVVKEMLEEERKRRLSS